MGVYLRSLRINLPILAEVAGVILKLVAISIHRSFFRCIVIEPEFFSLNCGDGMNAARLLSEP